MRVEAMSISTVNFARRSHQAAIRWSMAVGYLVWLSGQASAADLERGFRIFKSCSNCHVVDTERSTFGPSLKGVVGRRAGSLDGYGFSSAMREAGREGLVWTA